MQLIASCTKLSMAFIEPMQRNKPNITSLLTKFSKIYVKMIYDVVVLAYYYQWQGR